MCQQHLHITNVNKKLSYVVTAELTSNWRDVHHYNNEGSAWRHAFHSCSENCEDGVGESSLASGAESPPNARHMSTSDLTLVCVVVCPIPMARLVVAPTSH